MKPVVRTTVSSPLGPMLLAASPDGLCGAWFTDGAHRPSEAQAASWPAAPDHPVLAAATAQLAAYFRGERKAFDLPLDLSAGTAFQVAAWSTLLQIGWGHTIHYGELARRLGRPSAARAAGAAIGRNPLCVIVPCHRVIGSNGSLTGYAGGLPRKTALLQLEQSGALP